MYKIQIGKLYKVNPDYMIDFNYNDNGRRNGWLDKKDIILCLENEPSDRGSNSWYKFLHNNEYIFIDKWQVDFLEEVVENETK